MSYLLHILILANIYSVAAVSLNLIAGFGGMLSVAHAAFYGIGAYVIAILALNFGFPFSLTMICAVGLAAIVGMLVGVPGLRTHGDYFAIATFGLQVIIHSVMTNWVGLTGGLLGLPGIPRPTVLGVTIDSHVRFLFLTLIAAVAVFAFSYRLVRSPFGRMLRAVREDEILARALGKNVVKCKLVVFACGAGLAAIGGALYAYHITFIDPSSFTVQQSIFMLAIVIIGGTGNLWGSVLGAAVLIGIPEILRFLGIPSAIKANIQQILYGALLVAFMMFRPQGMIGEPVLMPLKKDGSATRVQESAQEL